ncbi:MAG: UDP-N-acetylglucosamine 2-epimerase (non-hydrolyzing) [Cryomorphaceae bacterium]|jgi:UDP-N-acetylglucosamine 2-epimerase (non-hydrolysing)|nr:UDP-N-acetylglucosamine 2-epimerase (non-hydrolyzing) [Cryomorphaceae bacterium]
MHLVIVAGTRPNFVKISPIVRALSKAQGKGARIDFSLVHTGQHYDRSMSGTFFEDLEIPEPEVNLCVGSGTQTEQTAAIMMGFERFLLSRSCDMVIVVGDVTSTMACAIVTKKLNILLAHVEGGIRSFDVTMPEEINRKVTDSITDHFFTTSRFANENLRKEGIPNERIHFVGNVMIDSLVHQQNKLYQPSLFEKFNLDKNQYLVLTLHRPSNVDDPNNLLKLLETIRAHSQQYPVIFPIHPRTKKVMEDNGINIKNLHIIDPMSYSEFIYLIKYATAVITDSGGITEETTVLGVPCLTLRNNTERPETCIEGTNELIGTDPANLQIALETLFAGKWKKGNIPEYWDGKSAERIVGRLLQILGKPE